MSADVALTASRPAHLSPAYASARERPFLSTLPAGLRERQLALAVVVISCLLFAALAPFAKQPLPPVTAFLPVYQSALVVTELITAVLLFGQFANLRSRALLVLASGYLFSALMAVAHALSFPGLFAPAGLLGAGPQTTAWIYFLWHGGFPLLVIAYSVLAGNERGKADVEGGIAPAIVGAVAAVFVAAFGLTLFTTAGHDLLPLVMQGNRDAETKVYVATASWMLTLIALPVLWRRRPHTVLDLWLAVVMCAWVFDIALAAVLNAGRYDLGWYAGRIYGLLAGSFVLAVLLLENGRLYAELAEARESESRRARDALARHAERLRILHEIDRAIVAGEPPQAIAGAVIRPLRELLDVPRAAVNVFNHAAGTVEWLAAAGRRRTHVGPGVRYPMRFMGDVRGLERGEPQLVDAQALPPGPEVDALLTSGARHHLVVPMFAGGELIGALSLGGESAVFPQEQRRIAQEVATQLAIAIAQAGLLERVKRHAVELESKVHSRTADLLAANRELDDLYNHAPCGYHSVDADGRFVRINDTWLEWLGYRREEVVGKLCHPDIMTVDSAERFRTQWFPLFKRQGWLKDVEFEYLRKDGNTFPASLSATTIHDTEGNYLSSRSTVFDITERRRIDNAVNALNAQLEAANRELKSFSYSVSHDLRAPLRAVDGYALMLQEEYSPRLDDEGRRLLAVVRAEAKRMGQLIDDLLAFSRTGQQSIEAVAVDMAPLARDALREAAREYPAAAVQIGELPQASGDRALLNQVWVNLIGNALKYSSKVAAPRIEIGGRANGAENEYWVRDNGAGFDPRYAGKLFGVFRRLHAEEEFPGTGVGLAIVRRIVTRHGGRVWAEGKPGEGACFGFALPKGPGMPHD